MSRGARSREDLIKDQVRSTLTSHLEKELQRIYGQRATGKTFNLSRLNAIEKELQHRENVRRMHRTAYGYGETP